eukprot:CAMPEP_0119498914 /NCGR_PEP_ID=MMETSP1344-20130328/21537_1 /TAXON_ID=236787 /ORGANISM="Florenciella parvula, Strain CCMP2471" /LENGTH=146 /DNA_ID=CAMNT_0007534855 /DNA_START=18 /DNA_END=458 /DNA_ORIENTATION=+
MTTNNYERLTSPAFAKTSEALFRPGRVDLRASFDHPDELQLRKFFADFFADTRPARGSSIEPTSIEPVDLKALEDRFIQAWPMELVKETGETGLPLRLEVKLSKYPFRVVKNYMLKCAFRGAAWAAQYETVELFERELTDEHERPT